MNDYIDPDRVRELARLHRKWGEEGAWAPKTESPHTQIADALESLLTPSRPTLADLFEEGHDLAQFHWMQADVLTQGETFRVVITRTVDKSSSAVTVSPAGYAVAYDQSLVTPLPDLPRLVWPAETSPEQGKEAPNDSAEPKVGEAWLINDGEREIAAILDGNGDWWHMTKGVIDLTMKDNANIFIARLVPEVQA